MIVTVPWQTLFHMVFLFQMIISKGILLTEPTVIGIVFPKLRRYPFGMR